MTIRKWTPLTRTRPIYDPDRIRITMNTDAKLLLNKSAFHALRSPSAVSLFMEEEAGLIGVAAVEPGTPNSLPVRKRPHCNQRAVSMRHFCTRFGLQIPKRGIHFDKPTFDPDGTLILDYRQAVDAPEI